MCMIDLFLYVCARLFAFSLSSCVHEFRVPTGGICDTLLVAGGGSMDRAAVWCVNFRMLQVSDDQTVYTKNGRNGILIPRPSVVHFGVRKWLVTMRKLTYDHT